MTEAQERDLRTAFEACMALLSKTGDTLARVETLQDGHGLSAVVVAVGEGVTYRSVRAIDALMDAGEKTSKGVKS